MQVRTLRRSALSWLAPYTLSASSFRAAVSALSSASWRQLPSVIVSSPEAEPSITPSPTASRLALAQRALRRLCPHGARAWVVSKTSD